MDLVDLNMNSVKSKMNIFVEILVDLVDLNKMSCVKLYNVLRRDPCGSRGSKCKTF